MPDPPSQEKKESPYLTRIRPHYPKPRLPKETAEVEYAPATREDAKAINDLYNKVFQQGRSLEHYMWKYWENPAGPPTGALAREKATGNCIATGIAQRRRGWVNGHMTYGALMCESATDPDMRGGGRLWREVMNGFAVYSMDNDGISWGYGGQSTDEVIKIGSRWFGYQVAVQLTTWEIRLSLKPVLEKRLGVFAAAFTPMTDIYLRARWRKHDDGYKTREVHSFGAEYDNLWERYRDRYTFSFYRDAETLNWRYVANPEGKHRILEARLDGKLQGYVVWREWMDSGTPIATVLDLWHGKDQGVLECLLDAARRKAAVQGCTFLRFAVQEGSPEEEALEAFHSSRKSPYERLDKIIFTPSPGTKPDSHAEQVYHDQCTLLEGGLSWFYTQGDCDFRD
ncbi:MAG: GNAT family N-acetyltransferase [Planctomycetota bacterium]|nr:GNAT family N-acetyltransferase [Planctomycetota bacterium]